VPVELITTAEPAQWSWARTSARLLTPHVADRTARYMEYRWTPEPYLIETYVARTAGERPTSAR
jgi:hypothetical protein